MIVTNEKCYICGHTSNFTIDNGATLLREAICEHCKSSLRNSDTAKVLVSSLLNKDSSLSESFNELKSFKIVEAQASGSLYDILHSSPNYTCFEYFDDVPFGEKKGNILCNNLEELTFENKSFDVIITQDVFEHIYHPDKAFSEINRILKQGGKHIFTIPLHSGRKTLSRTNLPDVYHGDPIRESGALVKTDWGDDIIDVISNYGMSTNIHQLHAFYSNEEITNANTSYYEYLTTEPLKYYKYNSVILESTKTNSLSSNEKTDLNNSCNSNLPIFIDFKLINYGPDAITAGQNFNLQPNGENAIWCETQNAYSGLQLVLKNTPLKTEVNENGTLVTAIIPKWLYDFSGSYDLYLKDPTYNLISNKLTFVIHPLISTSPSIDSSLYADVESLQHEIIELREQLANKTSVSPFKFTGWDMSTNHSLPWKDNYKWNTYRQTCEDIKTNFSFGLFHDIGINEKNVDTLMWRHWIVSFAVNYVLAFTQSTENSIFIECGVGDGMSALFALNELGEYFKNISTKNYEMHLYDSWSELNESALSKGEYTIKGRYSSNSLERTTNNLQKFDDHITYHQGYIPDSLYINPIKESSISYLHIDLNSSVATIVALEYFFPKTTTGSVILFDDYGWSGFEDTRELIDKFFSDKSGILLKLPTGQAIYYVS